MPLTIGQVLQERYRIDALLGQGGMGAVYRATDLRFGTPVAIKENHVATPQSQKQFGREASLLHQLRHPHLPRVTDYFFIAGQGQYLIMDFVEGEDLKAVLDRQGPLPEMQALTWVLQVLDALEYLHSRNIIHRDVKPSNIKITPQGQIVLVDFGLAKVYDPIQRTTIGARGVTPGFAPPEQYGQGRTDARSDLYSVGATLYALLTGQTPPEALDFVTGRAELVPPRHYNPGITTSIEDAILKAMQTRADDRFQTAAEFRLALSEARSPGKAAAKKASSVFAAPTLRSVPRWLWVAGIFVLLLVLTVGIWQLLSPGNGPTSEPILSAGGAVTATLRLRLDETSVSTASPTEPPSTPTLSPQESTESLSPSIPARSSGERIAFQSDRDGNNEIYVMNPDGSGLTRLTDNPANDHSPEWSPDGRYIAFRRTEDTNADGRISTLDAGEIYVMNADGTDQICLTNNPADDGSFSWSPDDQHITFKRAEDTDSDGEMNSYDAGEIYVMNADGTEQIRLTNDLAEDWSPIWSPDGQRIAFTRKEDTDGDGDVDRDDNPNIFIMNPDGGNLTNLTLLPGLEAYRVHGLYSTTYPYATSPSWSPDSRRIVFEASAAYLFLVNIDGSELTRLAPELNSQRLSGLLRPSWSPDGKYIGFCGSHDRESRGVYLVSIQDAFQKAILLMTDRGPLVWHPSWAPDGRRLAFHAQPGEDVEIFVVNVDGSGLTNLTNHPARDSQPAWSP